MARTPMPSMAMAVAALWAGCAARASDDLFKFVETVQVTPDATFHTGSFARVNELPAKGRLVVTFGDKVQGPSGECQGAGWGYKEFDLKMRETGVAGHFLWVPGACAANDSGSVMADGAYYFVWVPADITGYYGWKVIKYDPVTWQVLAETLLPLWDPYEASNDPMVAYVNGQIDISGQFNAEGPPPPPEQGAASHHTFLGRDLTVQGKRLLSDVPHVHGSSMIYLDGVYHFVTANAFVGDLIVMHYDSNWTFLGMKVLKSQAHFSEGIVFDGERFYLSYLDTSQRVEPGYFPIVLNVRLAAFDREWNLLQDEAVTTFDRSDNRLAGRPWLILHKKRLYLSYDVDALDPITKAEQLQWQAYVAVYEIKH